MTSEINYINRSNGEVMKENPPGENTLQFLYHTPFGKLTLHALIKRKFFSNIFGSIMSRRTSRKRVKSFVKKYQIDLNEYICPEEGFQSFNDFFYRKLKPGMRPIEGDLVSPADGRVLAFDKVRHSTRFFVKGMEFSLDEFLDDEKLAEQYEDGAMMIVRLAPDDYHRFHFPAKGIATESREIRGRYFSVSPLALQLNLKIFLENKREYSVLKTEKFGDILISEIGATMVGSILQTYAPGSLVEPGDEKGYFAFGGSTVVLLFEKGKVKISDDIINNTKNGFETKLRMGECIGEKCK